MSADPGSVPSSPFLAFVGPQDRSPMRVGLWLCLALPLAALVPILLEAALAAIDPSLLADPPASGPHRLLGVARMLGGESLILLALAAPVVGAARVAFQRPVWTFAAPTRPFSAGLFGWGLAVGAGLALAILAVKALEGHLPAPPPLDQSQPAAERGVYVLALVPIVLMMDAALELMFRGVILQVTAAFLRTRIGLCVVNGLVSGLISTFLAASPDPLAFMEYAVTGGAFAYAVLELGGLEFSIGASFASDFVPLLLDRPAFSTHAFHWSDLLKLHAWIGLAELAVMAVAIVAVVRLIKRRRGL